MRWHTSFTDRLGLTLRRWFAGETDHPSTSTGDRERPRIAPLPQPPDVLAEPLEPRQMLSGGVGLRGTRATRRERAHHHAATTAWAVAPFNASQYRSTVYVNQYGHATLAGEPLNATDGYDVFFDDGGWVTVTSRSQVPTDVAYYTGTGAPSDQNDGGGSAGTGTPPTYATTLTDPVSPDKNMEYVAVRPNPAGTTAPAGTTVDVSFDGPREGVPYPLTIDPSTDAGYSGSTISGTHDYDFYRVTLPQDGNWAFSAVPAGAGAQSLDISIDVYDNNGFPVGGTYTTAINNTGPGGAESWTGYGLKAGQTYWIRVDNVNDQTGAYTVATVRAPDGPPPPPPLPTVGVTASYATARLGTQPRTGQFTVTRSDTSPTPLTLHYRIKGTAMAGRDYQPLSGTVTIPANATSAAIDVTALRPPTSDRNVVVLLYADDTTYQLNPAQASATVTVLG